MGRVNAHQMIETVYGDLHRAILDRRLRPGNKLREQALGELFGVSRTTIRAALQRLEADGLVTIEPNKGASVSLPSVSEVGELFHVRRIVEIGIAAQLCAAPSHDFLASLRSHVALEHEAIAAKDYRRAIELLGNFHVLLAEATGNRILVDFFKGIVSRTSLVVSAFDNSAHAGCRGDEHGELIELIARRDVAGAIRCTEKHLLEIETAITEQARRVEADYHPLQHLFGEGEPSPSR